MGQGRIVTDFLFGIARVVFGLLVGCCGVKHCFWHLCFASSSCCRSWGHVLALVSPAVLCDTTKKHFRWWATCGGVWRGSVLAQLLIDFLFWVLPFNLGDMSDLFYSFDEFFCQAVGLWVIWCCNSGFHPLSISCRCCIHGCHCH